MRDETEQNEPQIPISDLIRLIKSMPKNIRSEAINLLEKALGKDFATKADSLTGTSVRGFLFESKFYEAESHIDVLRELLELIVKRFPDEQEKLLGLHGKKRNYFSRDLNEVSQQSEKIKGTSIYFEKCDNANTLRKRCKDVLKLFGIDTTTFEVIEF